MTLTDALGHKLAKEELAELELGLEDATGYQKQVGDLYAPSIRFKGCREALNSLKGALESMAEGKNAQPQK